MIHSDLLETIKANREHGQFIYPYYGEYSIAEIEPTIRKAFGIRTGRRTFPDEIANQVNTKKVLLMVVDGMGYDFTLRHGKGTTFFDTFEKEGNIYPITSVFPSTTPAALTTIHSGFTPQEHGLPEWFTYFREFGKIIMPMQFRSNWDEEHNILMEQGGTHSMLYEQPTMYETLQQQHIPSYVFVYYEYVPSAYNDAILKGSTIVVYREAIELFEKLRALIAAEPAQAFYHIYWGQVDSAGHKFGPDSPEYRERLQTWFEIVQSELIEKTDSKVAEHVSLIMTADHGQIKIYPEKVTYLNDHPFVIERLQKNDRDEIIYPSGSPNDLFLFVEDKFLEETIGYLRNILKDKAEVITTHEAFRLGLYGLNMPSQRFIDRVGNVLVVPYPGFHVWYSYDDSKTQTQKGIHGGLSEQEMIVPLGIVNLNSLQK